MNRKPGFITILIAFLLIVPLAYMQPGNVYAVSGITDTGTAKSTIESDRALYQKGNISADQVLDDVRQVISYEGYLEDLVEKHQKAAATAASFRQAVQDLEEKLADIIDAMKAAENAQNGMAALSSSYGGVSLNSTTETFTLEEYETYLAKLKTAESGLECGISGESLWFEVNNGLYLVDDDTAAGLTKAYNDYSAAKEEFCQALTNLKAVIEAAEAADAEGLYDDPKIVKDENMQAGQKVTYNCIWFGSYPQIEIVDAPMNSGVWAYYEDHVSYKVNNRIYKLLQKADGWDKNGDITLEGVKYRRLRQSDTHTTTNDTFNWGSKPEKYRYFRYMPIKWRILDHTVQAPHDEVLLSADMLLDCQQYNRDYETVSWATSTVRSWLNGLDASNNDCGIDYTGRNFINSAFTAEERSWIPATQLKFDDTLDEVFLLRYHDVDGNEYGEILPYGFKANGGATPDEASYRTGTGYARAMGAPGCYDSSDPGCWWTRTTYDGKASAVWSSGYLFYNETRVDSDLGICPAVSFEGLESTVYKPAGTVCTDGTVKEKNAEIVQETQSLTVTTKTKTVKYKKVRKKARTVKPLTVKNAVGTVKYTIAGGSKKAKKALSVNAKNGKITVKKKTKKGTYKIKIKVAASGSKYYEKASATKTLTIKVK